MNRRHFLYSGIGAAGVPLFGQNREATIDESDAHNIKLCHRLVAERLSDDDLRFLQQIGLRWVRLEFGEGDVTFDWADIRRSGFSESLR
jgi:hypothetical protein